MTPPLQTPVATMTWPLVGLAPSARTAVSRAGSGSDRLINLACCFIATARQPLPIDPRAEFVNHTRLLEATREGLRKA